MTKDTLMGVDLAKAVFQLHAASMTGQPRLRKKLSRQSFSKCVAEQPRAVVVMEACGSAAALPWAVTGNIRETPAPIRRCHLKRRCTVLPRP